MKSSLRALGMLLVALFAGGHVNAQTPAELGERDKVGYMIGHDVGRSIGPGLPDLELAAFQRAVENGMAGGNPLLNDADAKQTGQALMAAIGARRDGKPLPALDRTKAGLLVGARIGQSLASLRGEFDMPMFLRGVKDAATPGATPLLNDAELSRIRTAFSSRVSTARETERLAKGQAALEEERAFLAGNKGVKGVFTTPSGLQYMVLRQGNGVRPRPGQSVRVHYVGTLLDGTKFDSSYDRGQPAEFGLDQVIRGWSEGVAMMPTGAKYRFWVPAHLGYGEKGAGPAIPPNATLVFEVELLGVE